MAARHTDKLVKSFLDGSSNNLFDAFTDLQDPTYLTFKLDFFPDGGRSFPDDVYSSGGLFRTLSDSTISDYTLYDSAAEYLARIGAPTRQAYLEIFYKLVKDLQDKAPWYFQSISGLSELYKIDPAVNFRGKEKILTIECLESIDLRVTMLADLYRNIAFDMQNMREVLPINLRTFNMNIHVLEFRNFNTTYGIIADHLDPSRAIKGQKNQQAQQIAQFLQDPRIKTNKTSSLFTGTFDNVNKIGSDISSRLGGVFANLGEQAGFDKNSQLNSAFEAISVQTFFLKDCEFDFFSEAPQYLDTVYVKYIPEESHRFKIKVGKIQKTGFYSFYDYIISEHTKFSNINALPTTLDGRTLEYSRPYFEQVNIQSSSIDFENYREAIFPKDKSNTRAFIDNWEESSIMRGNPLEKAIGSFIRNQANGVINDAAGNLTNGVIGNSNSTLSNVFSREMLDTITKELNGVLTPENHLVVPAPSPQAVLGQIVFNATNLPPFVPHNVYK